MKKFLLTLIMSIVFGGTIFAQVYPSSEYYNPNNYESYFYSNYDFYSGDYSNTTYPIAYLKCNDALIGLDDNWADYEVASFINGELRGMCFLTAQYSSQFWDWGYEIPMFDGIFLYSNDNEANAVVTFKVYDHSIGVEYECTTNMVVTPSGNYDGVYDDPEGVSDQSLIISFTRDEPQTYTKDITGYGTTDLYWYFISSPIGAVDVTAVDGLVTDNYDLFAFDQIGEGDETNNYLEWRNYKVGEFTQLEVGKGYLYASQTDTQLAFAGAGYENTESTVTIQLEYDADANFPGMNLVGNPFGDVAIVEGVEDFYLLDPVTGEYEASSGFLDAMEGALVEATAEGQELTLTSVTGDMGGGDLKSKLNVRVSGSNGGDYGYIRFDQGHGLTKYMFNPSHTRLSFQKDDAEFAVVYSEDMGEMPVNFKPESDGAYTLSFSNENVEFNYLHLIDNLTGAEVDLLASPSYSFEAKTTDYASRFKLVYATGANDDSFAFFSNGSFVISNEGEATLQVVDVTGRILSDETINGSANVHVNAAPGVYMLRLINGDNAKVQKVIVK